MKRNPPSHGETVQLFALGVVVLVVLLTSRPAWASTDPGDLPTSLATAVGEALNSWSEFSATGDLDVVREWFAVGAPQWRQFVSESRSGVGGPQKFILQEARLRRLGGTTATVWTAVEVTRPGHAAETFSWDFDLTFQKGRWLVWTVVAADRPTDSEGQTSPPSSTTTPNTNPTAAAPVPTDPGVEMLANPSNAAGTRIPALSAWIVVVTVIGVAIAGYVAPRLDRRRQ